MNKKSFTEIKVGDIAQIQRKVNEADIVEMARISGDFNPVHMEDEYAKKTRFKKRIAHGLFGISMISALLGNELPGLGTIILSEQVRFLKPIYIGDTITAQVEVKSIVENKRKIILTFLCENQDKVKIMTGSTEVIVV